MKLYFAFLLAAVVALPASAHPGKTDRDGGHKCYKECAEWDLYYDEYHLHDKYGKTIRVARNKKARSTPKAAQVENKVIIEDLPTDRPAVIKPFLPVAVDAAIDVEPDTLSLPWILLMLFLLLLLVVRRNRRKVSDAEQAVIS